MDSFHRQKKKPDTQMARACVFCERVDPDFTRREPFDQVVRITDSAAGHITENGHARHRILELTLKLPHYKRGTLLHPQA
jgi:hypothetical protein